MVIISHRGNIEGAKKNLENRPDNIDIAINLGFNVEIDIWYINKSFFLGHNKPENKISLNWILERKDSLWLHCKDLSSLEHFNIQEINLNYFFHQTDEYTLTSKNYIWVYPKKNYCPNSIIVSTDMLDFEKYMITKPLGVCTDYPIKLKNLIDNEN